MEPATAALIARAAIAAGTNKKVWTGIASVLAALCLPVILAVMCYISIASGGTEHNRAAVHLAFDGGEAPEGTGLPVQRQSLSTLFYWFRLLWLPLRSERQLLAP